MAPASVGQVHAGASQAAHRVGAARRETAVDDGRRPRPVQRIDESRIVGHARSEPDGQVNVAGVALRAKLVDPFRLCIGTQRLGQGTRILDDVLVVGVAGLIEELLHLLI